MKNLIIIFKALSDPNRMRIIKMLEEGELCLCEITNVLNLANSTVSKHLSILREAGLIVDLKEGKWVNFKLAKSPESIYVKEIQSLLKNWINEDKTVRADKNQTRQTDRIKICGC